MPDLPCARYHLFDHPEMVEEIKKPDLQQRVEAYLRLKEPWRFEQE